MSERAMFKKQCLEKITNYRFRDVLKYVGDVSYCKRVSKTFVPRDYVTAIKFDPNTSVTMIFAVLSRRNSLEQLDFTGSVQMNDSMLHMVLLMHPTVQFIVLDECMQFEDFPSFSCYDEVNYINLNTHSVMKWKDRSSPTLSFRGCWKLFFPSHNQNPEYLTHLIMHALNDHSTYAMDKISVFCIDIVDWFTRIEGSSMIRSLKQHKDWNIRYYEKCGNKAFVLMDVVDYSLVVWIFAQKTHKGKLIWMLLGIWKVSIYRIWKLCKIFAST